MSKKQLMFSTFEVSNLLVSAETSAEQSKNIWFISVALDVSRPLRSILLRLLHFANILLKSVRLLLDVLRSKPKIES